MMFIDVVFDFVDYVLGRLWVVYVQGLYCGLVVDAEVDTGVGSAD